MKWTILAITLLLAGCGVRTMMPGKSFKGPLPPLSAEEAIVSANLRFHVNKLAGEIGVRNVQRPAALESAAQYIEAELRRYGEVRFQPYECAGTTVRNIELTIPGTTKASEIVVVGAHYDSCYDAPGANDNASGVAATIEIARLLHERKFPRTIRYVAFVNEEPPFFKTELMGSYVYAKLCKKRKDNIVAMITPETIGWYSDKRGSQRLPFPMNTVYPNIGNYIMFVATTGSTELLVKCVDSFRKHAKFPSEGGAASASIEGVDWSDHWSFNQFGYQGLMVTDTAPLRYPYYHTTEDTPDKLDYDKTARVVEGLSKVVIDLATN